MASCDQLPLMHAYHDGELSPERARAAEAHARGCAMCAGELASLKSLSTRLQALKLPAMPVELPLKVHARISEMPDRGALRLASWLTAAAAAVVIASVTWMNASPTTTQSTRGSRASRPLVAWESAAINAHQRMNQTAAVGEEYQFAEEVVEDLSMQLAVSTDYGRSATHE